MKDYTEVGTPHGKVKVYSNGDYEAVINDKKVRGKISSEGLLIDNTRISIDDSTVKVVSDADENEKLSARENSGDYTARLRGSGAIAQGEGAMAAGEGGIIIGGSCYGGVIVSGSGNEVDGIKINRRKKSHGGSIAQGEGAMAVGAGGIIYQRDAVDESPFVKVNERYNVTKFDKTIVVKINSSEKSDLELKLTDEPNIRVDGKLRVAPKIVEGKLIVSDLLKGIVYLPKSLPNLRLEIESTSGDIIGDVSHAGTIKTSSGEIFLNLLSSRAVYAHSNSGKVSAPGMKNPIKGDKDYFKPLRGRTLDGQLDLISESGNIKIFY